MACVEKEAQSLGWTHGNRITNAPDVCKAVDARLRLWAGDVRMRGGVGGVGCAAQRTRADSLGF